MFLTQENVVNILAKMEMDAADPPIPQSKMGEMIEKSKKEVSDFM